MAVVCRICGISRKVGHLNKTKEKKCLEKYYKKYGEIPQKSFWKVCS